MSLIEPSADELLQFAESYAHCDDLVNTLIETHIHTLTDKRWEVAVAGMAWAIHERSDPTSMAHLLATAVHRLAGIQQGWTDPYARRIS